MEDLFGNEIIKHLSIKDRFIVPPFYPMVKDLVYCRPSLMLPSGILRVDANVKALAMLGIRKYKSSNKNK